MRYLQLKFNPRDDGDDSGGSDDESDHSLRTFYILATGLYIPYWTYYFMFE